MAFASVEAAFCFSASTIPVGHTQLTLCAYKAYCFVAFGKTTAHKLKKVPEPDRHYKINYTVNLMLI